MASNSDISDDQVAQILPQISRLLQTVAAPDAEASPKDYNVARIQDIMHERDLYEKKLKALTLVLASVEKENSDLKKEVSRYERHIESAGAFMGSLITFMSTPAIITLTNNLLVDFTEIYRETVRTIQAGLMSALPK